MKYKSLEKPIDEIKTVDTYIDGIDFTQKNLNDKGYISKCKNMSFDNGRLVQRSGILSDLKNVVNIDDLRFSTDYSYTLLNNGIYFKGDYKKVAIVDMEYDISHRFLYIRLINPDCSIEDMGYIHFARVDDTNFFVPFKYTVFSGKAQNGNGLYAFVSLKNIYDESQTEYRIYESFGANCEWQLVYNYYIPTVYINGRGNSYDEAKASNTAYTSKPYQPEGMNFLCDRFYSYFSSDGYSYSFRLPYSNLFNEPIICRIYYDDSKYVEWVAYENQNFAKNTFLGNEITFNINRENGSFNFTYNGSPYAIPIINTYGENNIRILAGLKNNENYNNVVSCNICVQTSSLTVLSGGNDKNKIYYSKFENPLYFPIITSNSVGTPETPVTSLKENGKKLYIFKENSVYLGELKNGSAVNNVSLLADNSKTFFELCEFKIECVCEKLGCKNNNKSLIFKGTPFFFGNDKKIYAIKDKVLDDQIKSKKIEPLLNEIEEGSISLLDYENKILLCYGNNALVLEINGNSYKWFEWEFPLDINVLGSVVKGNKGCLVCQRNGILFTVSLQGEKDIIIDGNLYDLNLKNYDIISETTVENIEITKYFKCRVYKIFTHINPSKQVKIKVDSGLKKQEFSLSSADYNENDMGIWLKVNMFKNKKLSISYKGVGGISIGSTYIYLKRN